MAALRSAAPSSLEVASGGQGYHVQKGSPWQPDQMSSTSRTNPKVKLNSRPATVAMYCLPFSWQCSGISLKSPLVSRMTTIHAAGHQQLSSQPCSRTCCAGTVVAAWHAAGQTALLEITAAQHVLAWVIRSHVSGHKHQQQQRDWSIQMQDGRKRPATAPHKATLMQHSSRQRRTAIVVQCTARRVPDTGCT